MSEARLHQCAVADPDCEACRYGDCRDHPLGAHQALRELVDECRGLRAHSRLLVEACMDYRVTVAYVRHHDRATRLAVADRLDEAAVRARNYFLAGSLVICVAFLSTLVTAWGWPLLWAAGYLLVTRAVAGLITTARVWSAHVLRRPTDASPAAEPAGEDLVPLVPAGESHE